MTNTAKIILNIRKKGGPGSGHHGHSGLPGKHGGSRPGKGGKASGKIESSTPEELWGKKPKPDVAAKYGEATAIGTAAHFNRTSLRPSGVRFLEKVVADDSWEDTAAQRVARQLLEAHTAGKPVNKTHFDSVRKAVAAMIWPKRPWGDL